MDKSPPTDSVAVVGLGTMGIKITELCLSHGFRVIGVGHTAESGKRALEKLSRDLSRKVEKGKVSPETKERMLSSFRLAETPAEIGNASIIMEAVTEDVLVKRRVYREIEPLVRGDAILATNTSSLSVAELASELARPDRFVGLHFFNPPEVMKLVEVRRGERTAQDAVRRSSEFAAKLGRTPISVPDTPGYYVNRILFPMLIESILVSDSPSANSKDIDQAMKLGANHPMGPLELCDFIGNDVVLRICEILHERTRDHRFEPPAKLVEMVKQGKLGRKTGEGFYKY